MKKIMMLLMVSIFFLMGGMSEGMVQKNENQSGIQVFLFPTSILKHPGESVRMTFSINGIGLGDFYLIYVVVQKPGKGLDLLLTIGTDGVIRYRKDEIKDRITAFYSSSNNSGAISISNLLVEDTGDYYVAIGDSNTPLYWSNASRLTVSAEIPWRRK